MAEAIVSEDMGRLFAWQDYAVFASMLVVSASIGVYHGISCRKKKTEDAEDAGAGEFLIGGGKMQTIPVALSMLASFLSSITLMGQPAEVYMFGPQIWLMGIASFVAVPIVSHFFVPFFRNLNTSSAYEYFGRRFNRKFQLFASSVFTVQMLLFLALVLYAPALALHQVTGINTEVVVIIMYVVCIFYTTIGGIKAVVWTDSFQVIVLYAAMFAVLIKGTIDIGGIDVVWQRNAANQRDNLFNFDFDPTTRYTVWTTFIGGAFLHLSVFAGNQLQIQRFMTVPSVKEVRKMLWINAVGWAVVLFLTAYAGMLIFAKYYECDPLMNKEIKTADQLFPLYVMDVLGMYKGFPGLFVAGIFSAGLSTVSTGVNSLAAIWFAELEGTEFKAKLSPRKANITVKLLALFFGLFSFGLVFLVPYMGALTPIAISLSGFFSGSLFAIFLLGIYVPFANAWGAFAGLTCGTGVVGWITVGAQWSVANGYKVYDVLPLSNEGCAASNATVSLFHSSPTEDLEPASAVFRISFMWYAFLASAITFTVGIIVSYIANCVSPTIPVSAIIQRRAFQRSSSNKSRELKGHDNPSFTEIHSPAAAAAAAAAEESSPTVSSKKDNNEIADSSRDRGTESNYI